jgi:hypothetical protein
MTLILDDDDVRQAPRMRDCIGAPRAVARRHLEGAQTEKA